MKNKKYIRKIYTRTKIHNSDLNLNINNNELTNNQLINSSNHNIIQENFFIRDTLDLLLPLICITSIISIICIIVINI